jgi:hypothetical protein
MSTDNPLLEAVLAQAANSMDRSNIRPDQIEELQNYVNIGMPLNSCLVELISNNLVDFIGKADDGNRRATQALVSYMYNDMPGICWGSKYVYVAWLSYQKGLRDKLGEEEMDTLREKVEEAKSEASNWRTGCERDR